MSIFDIVPKTWEKDAACGKADSRYGAKDYEIGPGRINHRKRGRELCFDVECPVILECAEVALKFEDIGLYRAGVALMSVSDGDPQQSPSTKQQLRAVIKAQKEKRKQERIAREAKQ